MASFSNDVAVDSTLTVSGVATFSNDVQINAVLSVSGDAFFEEKVDVGSNLDVYGMASFSNDVTVDSTLSVSGVATFSNDVEVGSTLSVSGDVFLQKAVHIRSNLDVCGIAALSQEVIIGSDLVVSGDTSFNYEVQIGTALTVSGNAIFSNDVDVSKNLNVEKKATFNNISVYEIFQDSDERIKKNILLLDKLTALQTITQLTVHKYDHVTDIDKSESKIGLIAQDVKNIFSDAVTQSTKFIPNVLIKCVAVNSTTLRSLNDESINVEKDDNILLYDNEKNKTKTQVSTIESDNEIKLCNECLTSGKHYTIYGIEVSDFNSIDYTQILCCLISAFQQLYEDFNKVNKLFSGI